MLDSSARNFWRSKFSREQNFASWCLIAKIAKISASQKFSAIRHVPCPAVVDVGRLSTPPSKYSTRSRIVAAQKTCSGVGSKTKYGNGLCKVHANILYVGLPIRIIIQILTNFTDAAETSSYQEDVQSGKLLHGNPGLLQ